MASFGGRPAEWIAAALGIVLGGVVVFAVTSISGRMSWAVAGAIVSMSVLFVWLVLATSAAGARRGLALGTALSASALAVVVALQSSYVPNEDPGTLEAQLRQISSSSNLRVWYLGSSYNNWDLSDVAVMSAESEVLDDTVVDPGQELTIMYGVGCGDCGAEIEINLRRAGSSAEATVCLDGIAADETLREAAKALRVLERSSGPAPAPAKVATQLRDCYRGS